MQDCEIEGSASEAATARQAWPSLYELVAILRFASSRRLAISSRRRSLKVVVWPVAQSGADHRLGALCPGVVAGVAVGEQDLVARRLDVLRHARLGLGSNRLEIIHDLLAIQL